MGDEASDGTDRREPLFEPPPSLVQRPERRLTARVAAGFAAGLGRHEFRDNAVTLAFDSGGTRVTAVGSAVAAAFALECGPCALEVDADDLAACLRDACDVLKAAPRVVPFEAAVRTARAACVLLRGVLLPVDGGAEAVLSWKEVLDADATAQLRAELLRSIATTGGEVASSVRDVFAD
ncbi:hypothetical protein [Glacieibacterium sp.]|uniref:hypothetical protein n=1 Tax=Glacieibacterium sp. TaxID=2860237 RepID=UPI003B00060A